MKTKKYLIEMYYMRESEWSIPDETIKAIYLMMLRQNKADIVFLDGCIRNADEFLESMQNGNNWLFVILSEGEIIGATWLNRREGRMVRVHFCSFDGFTLSEKIDAAKESTDYILQMKDGDGYLFDCLVGYIPEFNKAAVMLVRSAGFRQAGGIPACLLNAATDKSESAVILYKTRNEL